MQIKIFYCEVYLPLHLFFFFSVTILESSLKRMEGHTESKEEVAEQYEKVSLFFEQVTKVPTVGIRIPNILVPETFENQTF